MCIQAQRGELYLSKGEPGAHNSLCDTSKYRTSGRESVLSSITFLVSML